MHHKGIGRSEKGLAVLFFMPFVFRSISTMHRDRDIVIAYGRVLTHDLCHLIQGLCRDIGIDGDEQQILSKPERLVGGAIWCVSGRCDDA